MKTLYILAIAILLSSTTTHAAATIIDKPTSITKTEGSNNTKEAESTKKEVKETKKIINGKDLHKLKFPKKFASKKTRYTFKK